MKRLFYFGLALLMGCTAKGAETSVLKENLLFLIHAKQAKVERHESNPSYGKLTLLDVSPGVTYFTDRPQRHSGAMPLEDFLSQWSEGQKNFQEVPPNAALVFYEGKGAKFHEVSLELRKPVYDPTHNQLQFNVYLLDKLEGDVFTEVTLFIDSRTINN